MMQRTLALVFVFCLLAAAAPVRAETVRLLLNWLPVGSFAGHYLAVAEGLHEAEGLTVEITHGGRKRDPVMALLDGSVDVASMDSLRLVNARTAGHPVKAIMAILQRSPVVFFALAETGIRDPRDFVGKTIRVSADIRPTLLAMMGNLGIAPSAYQPIDLPSDPDRVLEGDVDVWGSHFGGLVEQVRQRGREVNLVFPEDYGVEAYGQLLVTTDAELAARPDVLGRFARATIEGWRRVLADPDKVPDLITEYDPDADTVLQRQRLIDSAPLILSGDYDIGWMTEAVWQNVIDTLVISGEIDDPPEVSSVYSMAALRMAYNGRQ